MYNLMVKGLSDFLVYFLWPLRFAMFDHRILHFLIDLRFALAAPNLQKEVLCLTYKVSTKKPSARKSLC